ncbi:hypothetical protein FB565_007096 [Actinoplanes lutulentus]|uniref:Alpha/beta hydrolase family protein n=1 Tax=Actinoplanes lutulentus TaxID=1287878 RepID=A0A327ZAK8_9ACTN|nr:hypothetical protein [Actinoplanes lutulentus]MBB2947328.1 hypothetical protein [Actinoplanes lutulentus]RAK36603.1 hypothetical protein B0I29_108193 [Actinoplanes lutulentus]
MTLADQAEAAGVAVTRVVSPWADHTITLQFGGAPNQMALQLMLKHFQGHDTA